jgi:thiamine pyrophosphate-dependent acetolactate synthase large subunit-like protein
VSAVGGSKRTQWGSDLIAEAIADLGFEFAAINPGASYRGLHDSFVNHLGGRVDLIVCLHEEHAVALAHGWTKVRERPALAIVHSNVGLMHAVMAIYNAWVDRAPVLVLNATGPVDATKRRPWIEWIHTAQDHGALVRPFTKWDDQPGSAGAAVAAIAEAELLASTDPQAPTFVCLDVAYQEEMLEYGAVRLSPLARLAPLEPQPSAIEAVADRLRASSRIVLLAGRVGRSEAAWRARIELAERLGAAVITDIKTAAAFPTDHPNLVGSPGFSLDARQRQVLQAADAVLALDWIDLAGTTKGVVDEPYVVSCSLDPAMARGWVKNTYAQPHADVSFAIHADAFVASLIRLQTSRRTSAAHWWETLPLADPVSSAQSLIDKGVYQSIADALVKVRAEAPCTVTRYPLGWPAELSAMHEPLDYIGRDGGEGLGSGPGIAVGVALALKGSGRLPVAIVGDGDFMMGATALWTASNQELPLLMIVAANGVYGNDVVHQEKVARERGRSIEGKWIGQRIDEPRIDIAGLARAQGVKHAVRATLEAALDVILEASRHARTGPALVEIDMKAS